MTVLARPALGVWIANNPFGRVRRRWRSGVRTICVPFAVAGRHRGQGRAESAYPFAAAMAAPWVGTVAISDGIKRPFAAAVFASCAWACLDDFISTEAVWGDVLGGLRPWRNISNSEVPWAFMELNWLYEENVQDLSGGFGTDAITA